mmetsp:Transcript_28107/g.23220  ORF Transcript_28107/g.23220 Transcript_28107/m.23220 type:complete len:130 (+) Transcript_28107:333-722(+)
MPSENALGVKSVDKRCNSKANSEYRKDYPQHFVHKQLIGSAAALIAGLPKIALFMEHHSHLTIAVFGWISLIGVTIMSWWDSIIPMCVSFLFYFGTYYYANALVQAENGRVVKDVTLSYGGDSSYAMIA